jgi:hypothetical protein
MPNKILDIILTAAMLGAGLLTLVDKEYWPAGVALIIAGFLLLYFSNYISQIEENTQDIQKLKEKVNIYDRISKIEAKVDGLKGGKTK